MPTKKEKAGPRGALLNLTWFKHGLPDESGPSLRKDLALWVSGWNFLHTEKDREKTVRGLLLEIGNSAIHEAIQGLKEDEDEVAVEEASSILMSVKINYEKRSDLTVVEKELLQTAKDWLAQNPPPTGDA